jgi:LmbE family N-acetylglucosaminyl deacetylase
MSQQTLLVGLAHPDDEVGVAGTILAQRARGDRVVVVWLTRGEMTEAFGPLPTDDVARLRTEQGLQAGAILDVETRFLDFPDTRVEATHDAASRVARVIADVRPDGLLTWGDAWTRGRRHPDHQACGRIFRDAITLARIAKTVHPATPHRAAVPVWTLRDVHSSLPMAIINVEPYVARIHELGRFYLERIGFGDPAWIEEHLASAGAPFGLRYAEVLDAYETLPGLVPTLLPATLLGGAVTHPERPKERGDGARLVSP